MWGKHTLAVVLTGMGHDGRDGAAELRALGSQILVQDEETSVVWGMPGAVYDAGLADEVLPIDKIAAAIVRLTAVGSGFRRSAPASTPTRPPLPSAASPTSGCRDSAGVTRPVPTAVTQVAEDHGASDPNSDSRCPNRGSIASRQPNQRDT